jgi:tripeptidyl-peptidase-1
VGRISEEQPENASTNSTVFLLHSHNSYYFQPTFPAVSPYVLAVGATSFSQNSIGPERTPMLSFKSGGGFSWGFDRPTYQQDVVQHYLKTANNLPQGHFFNANGRAIPDVSLIGEQYEVVLRDSILLVDGTEPATAAWAGIVSLLNDIRLQQGRPVMGFINPWIYQTEQDCRNSFYDITNGHNQNGCCGYTGFLAQEGWDPVCVCEFHGEGE